MPDQLPHDLDIALNEANLLGVEVDPDRRMAAATFRVLSLPPTGPSPEDSRVQMIFRPVGRVVASLRKGRWDDPHAEVVPIHIRDLLKVVQSFQGQPIYGWEFFDLDAKELKRWGKCLSLDWRSGTDGLAHSVSLFQESAPHAQQHLDLCIWFDGLQVRRPDGAEMSLEEFAAGGRRWWDGLYAGDPRTQGHGIVPLTRDGKA